MKQQILALAVFTLTCTSCKNEVKNEATTPVATVDSTTTAPDRHTSENALDWNGTYEGVIPCADCPGIETELTLREDKTYSLSVLYQDREKKPTVTQGSFTFDATGSIITLDKNGDQNKYKVAEGCIMMLDKDGKEIESDLKENYILKKNN
ncbi:hypothetical protein FSS13T_26580 [Flavobacterium saliperosum S13]|uniref:Uncharacterized lipoprotein NlpE involved in copper resistance n=2 Tax=Flavobacterium saliperosum TaxID=329186 RepID=A0A1G4W4S4_9FLAO|nr:copper resistance protein NlpE [Flavobacterium saliperosum]ESU21501.1 hypothetical protein FSS13T_26580 [Flavobacterium saliperosum S13]SCX16751.1 Uncharacterized lipoprotein NlpE involved in copper resistance [Flavobacterium saliperosum]